MNDGVDAPIGTKLSPIWALRRRDISAGFLLRFSVHILRHRYSIFSSFKKILGQFWIMSGSDMSPCTKSFAKSHRCSTNPWHSPRDNFFLREWYVCPWQAARPSRVQAEQKWEEATLGKLPQSKNYKFTRAKMIHLASFYRIKPLSFLAHELALRTPNYGLNLREKRTDLRGWANHSEKRKRTAIDS